MILLLPVVANQRADTHSSLCSPDCSSLNLPRDIILIKMVPRESEEGEDPKDAACDMETVTKTKHAHSKGHVILLQIPTPCKAYQNAQEIWDLLQTLKPVLVLITLPTEEDSSVGPLYYRNKQTPVLWLRQGDGQGLAAALTAAPEKPIRLLDIPGAELVPVKDEFAGQPATTSALGPVSICQIRHEWHGCCVGRACRCREGTAGGLTGWGQHVYKPRQSLHVFGRRWPCACMSAMWCDSKGHPGRSKHAVCAVLDAGS
jgi:hypothetical protein